MGKTLSISNTDNIENNDFIWNISYTGCYKVHLKLLNDYKKAHHYLEGLGWQGVQGKRHLVAHIGNS